MEYPHHSTPEKAITDYLRSLLDHVSRVLQPNVGAGFTSMKFTYVITEPAIWSDWAKLTTLACEENAGMGSILCYPHRFGARNYRNPHSEGI